MDQEELPFPQNMREDIRQCVTSFDRSVYKMFRQMYLKKAGEGTDFDEYEVHNQWLFSLVAPNVAVSSVMRVLMFLLYSPNLPVPELFNALSYLAPRVPPDAFFYKVLKVIREILGADEHLLSDFARRVNSGDGQWTHFAAIGSLIERINPTFGSLTVRSFVEVSLRFSIVQLKAIRRFLGGIQTPLYLAYVKPFLDKQFLRNSEAFVFKAEYFLRPLEFSVWMPEPHSTPDFVDSLSELCQSKNEKVAKKAGELVSMLADRISPYAFPMRPKSMVFYFKSVFVARSTVAVAMDMFGQHGTTKEMKVALASFLTRALHTDPSLVDVNVVLEKCLIPNKFYTAISLILDVPGLNKELVISFAKQETNIMSLIILSRLGAYKLKEADISSIGTFQNWAKMTGDESLAYSELLCQLRHEMPFYAGKTMFSALMYMNEKRSMLNALDVSMSDCNEEFLDGFFSTLATRQPSDCAILVPLLTKFHNKFNVKEKALCVALGVALEDDNPEIAQILFSMRLGDWKKESDSGLLKLAARPLCHKAISSAVAQHINEKDYQKLIAGVFKYFSTETDCELLESVFFGPSPSLELMKACLLTRDCYKDVSTLLAELLIHRGDIESCSRRFLFSFIPKSKFTGFDFLLFVRFFRFLLSADEWDDICETISVRLQEFDNIEYIRGPIIDCLVDFEQADDALVHLYVADACREASDLQIARRIVNRPKFAEGFLESMRQHPGVFEQIIIASAFTTRDVYLEWLPMFSSYLTNICSLEIPMDQLALTIQGTIRGFYRKKEGLDKIHGCLLKLAESTPKLVLWVFQDVGVDGKCQSADQIFKFLTGLKAPNYDAQPFNRAMSKLFPEFSDKLVDLYFSHSLVIPEGSEASLYLAIKTSRMPADNLFQLVRAQAGPRISDKTIQILLGCMKAFSERDGQCQAIANRLILNIETSSGEELGLVFPFSTVNDKMGLLSQWLISETNKGKALVVLRYMFNIPSETKHIENMLGNLIELACDDNAKIVEAATKALRAAASSLDKDILLKITPYIISTIKPETTRYAIEAAMQFLIDVERKFPLALIFQIHLVFSVLHTVGIRYQKLDEFLEMIESNLRKSDMPPLLREIVAKIRTSRTVMEIFRVIDANIDQAQNNEVLSQICFSMIENYLTVTDKLTKAMAFKILSMLSLPETLEDKVLNYCYDISADSDKNVLYEHFSNLINRLPMEKRLYYFEQFAAKAEQSVKEFQTSGLSSLFGILIGATIDQEDTFSRAIHGLQNTKTTLFRDALMGSLLAFLQNRTDKLLDYVIETAKCFLCEAEECVAVSKRLLTDLVKILPDTRLSEFVGLFPPYMASTKSDVREMCTVCLITALQTASRANISKRLCDRLGDQVFTEIAAASYVLSFDFFQNISSQARKLNSFFVEGNKDIPLLSLEFVRATRGFIESPSDTVNDIGCRALASVVSEWMSDKRCADLDARADELLAFWSGTARCDPESRFPHQVVFVFKSASSQVSSYLAYRICELRERLPITDDFCISVIYAIITGLEHLRSIAEAFRKWKSRITGTMRTEILDAMFTLAHGKLPVLTWHKSVPRSGSPDGKPAESEDKRVGPDVQRSARNAFVEICVFLADDNVLQYIEDMKISPPDPVVLSVLCGLADQKPHFFISAPDNAMNRLLLMLFSDIPNDIVRKVEQVLTAVIINLAPVDIGVFLQKLAPFFMKFAAQKVQRMRLLLSDSFVSSLLTGVVTEENCIDIGPSIAIFIRAIFAYTSEPVRVLLAVDTVSSFVRAITRNPSMNLVNIVAVVSLFAPFMQKLQEPALVSTITAALCSEMTPALFIEVQSAMQTALSLGISTTLLISIARMRIDSAPSWEVLELIAFVLEASQEKLPEALLLGTWECVAKYSRSPNDATRVAVMRIAAGVVARVDADARQRVLEQALPKESVNATSIAGFLTAVKDISVLQIDQIAAIERFLGSQRDFITFLPAIPRLVKSHSHTLVVQCMNFLVQGIKASGYIVPKLSLETLAMLQPELHAMDLADSSIVVTALYLRYLELDNELKDDARETLIKILGRREEKNEFRERYFQSIDGSMLNVITRDLDLVSR